MTIIFSLILLGTHGFFLSWWRLSMTLHAKVAESVEEKSTLPEDKLAELTDIVGDEDKAKEIIEAAKHPWVTEKFPIIFYPPPNIIWQFEKR